MILWEIIFNLYKVNCNHFVQHLMWYHLPTDTQHIFTGNPQTVSIHDSNFNFQNTARFHGKSGNKKRSQLSPVTLRNPISLPTKPLKRRWLGEDWGNFGLFSAVNPLFVFFFGWISTLVLCVWWLFSKMVGWWFDQNLTTSSLAKTVT